MTLAGPATAFHIRPMILADLDQVQAIDKDSFTLPWPASAYRHEIENNQLSLCLVAETIPAGQPAQIAGFIVVWLILDEAHIATIATHPVYRQMGIARRLLAESLRASRQRQASSATLEVRASNLAAQELYFQFGFEIVGRRRRYYRDNQEDALIMTLANLDAAYIRWLGETADHAPQH
jgi:ribosomal-protein-alanine N-acetyltransferase